jgi:RimJ/RimL family protein N-acetyltransferase
MPIIEFEAVQKCHMPMLQAWLAQPHWREWWGDPETELAYIIDMVEGRDTTKPFVFNVDGKPIGYIQYWFIGPHQTEEWSRNNPWLMALPSEAVGVDISIGDPKNLSKGIGSAVLRAFVGMLYGEGYRTVIIDPDPKNTRAVLAYEKAGFKPVPHLLGQTGDALIMQHEPNANEKLS